VRSRPIDRFDWIAVGAAMASAMIELWARGRDGGALVTGVTGHGDVVHRSSFQPSFVSCMRTQAVGRAFAPSSKAAWGRSARSSSPGWYDVAPLALETPTIRPWEMRYRCAMQVPADWPSWQCILTMGAMWGGDPIFLSWDEPIIRKKVWCPRKLRSLCGRRCRFFGG
jgi:hypothetical protein